MKDPSYLIVFRETKLNPVGIHSGAETATLNLARALASRGKRVVLAAHLEGPETTLNNVEFWDIGSSFNVGKALRRARKLGKYHMISAGRALPVFLAREEKNCLSTGLITHDRTSGDSGINARVLAAVTDTIYCVSEAQKEIFLKDGVSPQKLVVFHNGVDLDLFPAGDPEKRDYKKIVFVGALILDKGIHLLVESFAKLRALHPGITLDVFGSSALWGRNEFLNTAELEAKLPGLKFHGNVDQKTIAQSFQTAGVCVLPSIWFDPFPLVSIDAQSSGCPVVAFDVGGMKEGITDGKTGVVIRDISEASLTSTLDNLLKNRDTLKAMSQQCLQLARGRFTWDKLADCVIGRSEKGIRTQISESESAPRKVKKKLGFLTTWNQVCGLATYGRYLVSQFEPNTFTILAEQTSESRTAKDEEYVVRCWRRDVPDYSALLRAIEQQDIGLLYLNTHYRFFCHPQFTEFLGELRRRGVKTIAHLHSTFTADPRFAAMAGAVDKLIVHTKENKLEAIANGAADERVIVLPHGVYESPYANVDRATLRAELGLPKEEIAAVCFGFVQPHKGIEGLLEGVEHMLRLGKRIKGYVLGAPSPDDAASVEYSNKLKQAAREAGLAEHIVFFDRFVSDDEVSKYLSASDLVLMNYRSRHFEASGACALAVGSGAVVAASIAPPFQDFGAAVWHLSAGYPVSLSFELLLTNQGLRNSILANARAYVEENSWTAINVRILEIFEELDFEPAIIKKEQPVIMSTQQNNTKAPRVHSGMRVLMQNRKNALTQRGGDSVVMEETKKRLEAMGVSVTFDLEAKEDPSKYDLVHIFNFALPQMVKALGEQAKWKKTPFVVTTLYEDIPSFHNQSIAVGKNLLEYVERGQDRDWYRSNAVNLQQVNASPRFDNTWAASNAATLLANGEREAATIRRDYPAVKHVSIVPVGYELGAKGDPELFYKQFGIRDFIFCVGRLETRKNQLMLLKALEDVDLPVVFAAGGFTYQPDYAQAVRDFRRRGKTLVLDRLSPEMLAAAYAACKIHVLPSWYELPGLVSLEAAYHERNVVVTERGTAPDYFSDKAFYCDPGSESSILQSVLSAFYSPAKSGLKEVAMKNSWDYAAEKTMEAYETALGGGANTRVETQQTASPVVVYDLESGATEFQEMLEKGELAARSKEFDRANEMLAKAERQNPQSARLMRARGAVYLAQGQDELARQYFERGVLIEPSNAKMHSGLGMCALHRGDHQLAHGFFGKALELAPNDLVAILQLIECAYTIGNYLTLEKVLRRYTADHQQDMEMLFCLAGCRYKQGDNADAARITQQVLAKDPTHKGAKQLQEMLNGSASVAAVTAPEAVQAPEWALPSVGAPLQSRTTAAQEEIPQSQSTTQQPSFDSTDERLIEIEELKRNKEYAQVRSKCDSLLARPELRQDQHEKATLIKAEVMVLQGEIAQAEALYDGVIAKNALSSRAMCGKGAISAHRDDWATARSYFENANKLSPTYDVPWAGLGVCNYWAKDFERAWDCFHRALEQNPENVRALLGIIELGYPLKRLGSVEKTIKAYLEVHPLDLEFVYSLAGCYFAQNKLEEAIAEIDKITLFDPSNQRASELREMIDRKLGLSQPSAF